MAKPKVLTKADFEVVRAIQKGMKRDHVIKKYAISGAKYDSLNTMETVETLKIDEAVDKLITNKSLIDAAGKLGVEFVEELHGLNRLDTDMQRLAVGIIGKLTDQLEECGDAHELQLIIQSFVMMRRSMFSTGPGVQVNNFSSMPAITSSRV